MFMLYNLQLFSLVIRSFTQAVNLAKFMDNEFFPIPLPRYLPHI